jgi:hypothetical protein
MKITRLIGLGVMGLSVVLAAESPHYKPGRAPICTINTATGTATCSSGSVTGLGNDDIRVTVSFGARADTFCHNPGNSLIVPGQNPTGVTASASIDISGDQVKNGNLTIPSISATAIVPVPSAAGAGCPNGSWTVTLGPVTYGAGSYVFEQPIGTVIPSLSFAF